MGIGDKAKNAAEQVKGKAKQAGGKATGDDEQQLDGQVDQRKGDLKQAGEKAKDALDG